MRTPLAVFIALILLAAGALSQQSTVATIDPGKPKVGDTIVLTYHSSSPGAALKDSREMIAEIMVLGDDEPVVMEPPMAKSGNLWKGSFQLMAKGAQIILFRFRSGERVDDNGENTWRTIIYGRDGRPVKGAHIASATVHQYPNLRGFKSPKNPEAAAADLAEETKWYPNNWRAPLARWGFMGRAATTEEGKTTIRRELDVLFAAHSNDAEAVAQLLTWYDRVGEKKKADSIRSSMMAREPKGKVAEAAHQDRIYQERDPAKRVQLIEEFLKEFPQKGSALENFQMQLFAFAMRANDYTKAEAVLASMEHPSGQMYNSLAWPFIEKGEKLEQAVAWAKKGVDLLDPTKTALKPKSMTTADWKQDMTYGRGMVLDTYAFGLLKLGKLAEAGRAFDEALRLTEYKDPEINERAAECLMANKQYQQVVGLSLAAISQGKANDKLMEHYKSAYVALNGSEKGFQESVDTAKNAARNTMLAELAKERVNKPAVDFSLKNLDGSVVALSGLRGKIVVVDFWATWCGPCLQSFPYLQKVYEKYKNDNDIVILAVNTWESKTGQELVDHVKDFISKNNYTFPVVFDEGFVDKYGVEGIPTKFIIDQNGMIQFKDIGFGGGEEMMQKMDLQFELLRAGSR